MLAKFKIKAIRAPQNIDGLPPAPFKNIARIELKTPETEAITFIYFDEKNRGFPLVVQTELAPRRLVHRFVVAADLTKTLKTVAKKINETGRPVSFSGRADLTRRSEYLH